MLSILLLNEESPQRFEEEEEVRLTMTILGSGPHLAVDSMMLILMLLLLVTCLIQFHRRALINVVQVHVYASYLGYLHLDFMEPGFDSFDSYCCF